MGPSYSYSEDPMIVSWVIDTVPACDRQTDGFTIASTALCIAMLTRCKTTSFLGWQFSTVQNFVGDAENARHENAGMEKAGKEKYDPRYWGWSCTRESWHEPLPLQEKEQTTQRHRNKSVHLSLWQRHVNMHSVSTRRRPLRWIARSLSRMRQCGVGRRWWWQPGGGGQRWRRPAVSRCCISGSLRSLHDSTARHTTSVCALRTPALFQVLWFLQCITKIEEEGRGYPMCRAPITKILRLF